MILPLKWLRDYIDIDITPEEFADAMTLTGTKAETLEYLGKEIENVVVGKVLEIEKHPDADKLTVVQIDIGTEKKQIITAATNLKIGDYIPVALHNAKLPGGVKIKRGNMRGVMSEGMFCSHNELGIDSKYVSEELKNGIYILNGEPTLGADIRDVLQLNDAIVEFELTANRPDCNSILGMAMEASATINKPVALPSLELKESGKEISVNADVQSPEMCNRYMLREVTNVKIAPSPYYIQRRLIEAGIRPINNIVDLTNYVMVEYGQPLHAFDYDKLSSNHITVKNAETGESCITLDGEERKLDSSMVTIRDGKNIIALGGVMGSLCSEIDENTTHVVLESANFDTDTIRATSKKLGLRSDASARFEKGIDTMRCEKALDRICHLIEEMKIGTVCKGKCDVIKQETIIPKIRFTVKRINETIGIDLTTSELINILNKLQFVTEEEGDTLITQAPVYRTDIEKTADIIEEISRIYGFNKIMSTPVTGEIIPAKKSSQRIYEDEIKHAAIKNGFTEILTYSFVSPQGVKKAQLFSEKENNFVKLLNPLGEETSVMRTSLIPNMLEIVSTNAAHKNDFFSGYEFGNLFFHGQETPQEEKSFVAAIYGKEEDFFTLKSRIEGILDMLSYSERKYIPNKLHSLFHPGRCADIYIDGVLVGIMGEVHPNVLKNFDIKKKVYLCQLNIPQLYDMFNITIKYKQIPKFPAMKRDIALVVDKKQYVSDIESIIRENGENIIEQIELFDVYQGDQVEEGKKSVAYSIVYRKKDATLTDEEVNVVQERILNALREKLNAVLR